MALLLKNRPISKQKKKNRKRIYVTNDKKQFILKANKEEKDRIIVKVVKNVSRII